MLGRSWKSPPWARRSHRSFPDLFQERTPRRVVTDFVVAQLLRRDSSEDYGAVDPPAGHSQRSGQHSASENVLPQGSLARLFAS